MNSKPIISGFYARSVIQFEEKCYAKQCYERYLFWAACKHIFNFLLMFGYQPLHA